MITTVFENIFSGKVAVHRTDVQLFAIDNKTIKRVCPLDHTSIFGLLEVKSHYGSVGHSVGLNRPRSAYHS